MTTLKLVLCLVLVLLTGISSSAWADSRGDLYVGGFLGALYPSSPTQTSSMSFSRVTTGPSPSNMTFLDNTKAQNVPFDSSTLVGLKGGYCFSALAWLCGEVQLQYYRLMSSTNENVNGTTTSTTINNTTGATTTSTFSGSANSLGLKISAYDVGFHVVARHAFMPAPEFPLGGRLHAYIGAGPSFVWSRAQETFCLVACGNTSTDFSVGAHALTGVRYFVNKDVSVFGEYMFTYWNSKYTFSDSGTFVSGSNTNQERASTTTEQAFHNHLFYMGVAFHFPK
jgi:hypothetical protein